LLCWISTGISKLVSSLRYRYIQKINWYRYRWIGIVRNNHRWASLPQTVTARSFPLLTK
jgi:hypothetical protein